MASTDFQAGGHVSPTASAYVERDFVGDCFSKLSRGRWVVLLGPRQHGKTSGLVRLEHLLSEASVKVARISLQGNPAGSSYPELLEWIARKVAAQLEVELNPPAAEHRTELDAWLAAALPDSSAQIALLLDEAAAIQDSDVRSIFYHQLRRLHDERDSPLVENLGRSFALLFSGTFEPKRLVADDLTSPFNVCETVSTEDLTIEMVHTLVDQVGAEQAGEFVDRAFELVGGQPFLVQYLLASAERGDAASPAVERYGQAEARLLVGDADHLSNLLSAVVNDKPIREIAREVLEGNGAPFAATPDHRMLVTLGFVRLDKSGRLVPRNPLYAKVAAQHPLLSDDQKRPPDARIAGFGPGAFDFVVDDDLRIFAEEMSQAAYVAFNDGHLRLALIGLGSSLEAILIDVLEQAGATELTKARNKAKAKFHAKEEKDEPDTWGLANLVTVSAKLAKLENSPGVLAAHAIRELRNFVHPALARKSGDVGADLKGEFDAAQGVLTVLVRVLG